MGKHVSVRISVRQATLAACLALAGCSLDGETAIGQSTTGAMRQDAASMDEAERRSLAVHLAGRGFEDSAAVTLPACEGNLEDAFDTDRPSFATGWFDPGKSRHIPSAVAGCGEVLWVYQATQGDAWNIACELEDDSNCPEERGPDLDFGAAILLARTAEGRDLVVGGQKAGAGNAFLAFGLRDQAPSIERKTSPP